MAHLKFWSRSQPRSQFAVFPEIVHKITRTLPESHNLPPRANPGNQRTHAYIQKGILYSIYTYQQTIHPSMCKRRRLYKKHPYLAVVLRVGRNFGRPGPRAGPDIFYCPRAHGPIWAFTKICHFFQFSKRLYGHLLHFHSQCRKLSNLNCSKRARQLHWKENCIVRFG